MCRVRGNDDDGVPLLQAGLACRCKAGDRGWHICGLMNGDENGVLFV